MYSITVLHANIPRQNHRKVTATIETTLKQLEYVTKGHKAMQTIVF